MSIRYVILYHLSVSNVNTLPSGGAILPFFSQFTHQPVELSDFIILMLKSCLSDKSFRRKSALITYKPGVFPSFDDISGLISLIMFLLDVAEPFLISST